MHAKTLLILLLVAYHPQSLGLGMMSVVEEGCVLHRQHQLMRPHPFYRSLPMGRTDAFRCDIGIIKETIGRLGIGPILAGLVDRRIRLLPQGDRQLLATSIEASIFQFDMGELIGRPLLIGGIMRDRQGLRFSQIQYTKLEVYLISHPLGRYG